MKPSTWRAPGLLYIFDINGMTKFGITTNLNRRKKQYLKELGNLPFREIKIYSFHHYWQAELVEAMMRFRLKLWAIHKRHEWIINLPVQCVIDCYQQVIQTMEPEYERCECFHYHEKARYGHYKNEFRILEHRFDQVQMTHSKTSAV